LGCWVVGLANIRDDRHVISAGDFNERGFVPVFSQQREQPSRLGIEAGEVKLRVHNEKWRLIGADVRDGRSIPSLLRIGPEDDPIDVKRPRRLDRHIVDPADGDRALDRGERQPMRLQIFFVEGQQGYEMPTR
jgi:hypothetical protein